MSRLQVHELFPVIGGILTQSTCHVFLRVVEHRACIIIEQFNDLFRSRGYLEESKKRVVRTRIVRILTPTPPRDSGWDDSGESRPNSPVREEFPPASQPKICTAIKFVKMVESATLAAQF